MEKQVFPKIEVLPHPIEAGIDLVARAFKYAKSVVTNTNVQFENTGAAPMLDRHLDEGR